jgi:hypothetical protein
MTLHDFAAAVASELRGCRLSYDAGPHLRTREGPAGFDVEGHWQQLLDLFNRYRFTGGEGAWCLR